MMPSPTGEKFSGTRVDDAESQRAREDAPPKQDRNGVVLSPQPSEDPMDPLNWPLWLKLSVLGQVSFIAFMTLHSSALITPALVPLSEFLHRNLSDTAYVTSTFVAMTGVAPFIWSPLANVYGRRPIWIICLCGSVAATAASGAANDYATLLALRMLYGIFGGVPLALGQATVCDLFFDHQRGLYMGIYTVSFIAGGHSGSIYGGFVQRDLTWRWCFYTPAFIFAGQLLLYVFTVPETLFSRSPEALARPSPGWMTNMLMKRHANRKLKIAGFLRPFQMVKYPSVLLPSLYYAVTYGYGSTIYILSSASIFASTYDMQSYQIGLLMGLPLTLGSLFGEAVSGGFSDWVSKHRALARGGKRRPEDRLLAIFPGIVLTPLGLIIEGVCVQHQTHWMGPAMGIAVASVGLQVVTTVTYTYISECYRPQAAHSGTIVNFFRQAFGFCLAFYDLRMGEEMGFQAAWITLAMINVAFSLPVLVLLLKGEEWRQVLGPPRFDADL